ncbi:MAG TPA: FAD/NAD(P)-binding protein [Polyangiaceae bacterium]|nr:FAD/NAD(P)-binding protein [Polyangiaceae bacterium]
MAKSNVGAPNCVTIFGAGITGLTAAHELIERGFRVQVWEPTTDQRHPERGCDVGGLARTQWGAVPWDEASQSSDESPATVGDFETRGTTPLSQLDQKFFFVDETNQPLELGTLHALGKTGEDDVHKVAQEFLDTIGGNRNIRLVYCEAYAKRLEKSRDRKAVQDFVQTIKAKFQEVFDQYQGKFKITIGELVFPDTYLDTVNTVLCLERAGVPPRNVALRVQLLDWEPDGLPDPVWLALRFRVRERWIAGEHGFRFFPAFYAHVFDSMKRTPLLEPVGKQDLEFAQERSVSVNPSMNRWDVTGRTAFDNLTPTTSQGVAFGPNKQPAILSRSLPTSIEELMEWIRTALGTRERAKTGRGPSRAFGSLDATSRDVSLFSLRVFQYLTASQERRRDYESVSWLEFLCGGEPKEKMFSPKFLEAITQWPEALVALRADEADARTQGTVSGMLLLDNAESSGFRDGTLNGPTNIAWLDHWRRYLEFQGVEFIHGRLEGFKSQPGSAGSPEIVPAVSCYEPRYPGALTEEPALMRGYWLLALPATEAWRVSRSYLRACASSRLRIHDEGDLFKIATYPLFSDADPDWNKYDDSSDFDTLQKALNRPEPGGELRHMVGIQYYFAEDIQWLDGHVTYPDAQLRISSISQARFWSEKHDWEHGHRGILSVILTNLDGKVDGKLTWTLPRATLAQKVWEQIRTALPDRQLPEPLYWHLDDAFGQESASDAPGPRDRTPIQVEAKGNWSRRPGYPVVPNATENGVDTVLSGYDVERGIVLAGTYMQTFTRLTTMEAANESARHAVNAILQDQLEEKPLRCSPCPIYPPEDREPRDLAFWKELDAELHGRGCEHFVDILELGLLVAQGFSGRPADPLDPEGALAPLAKLVREQLKVFP